MEGEPSRPLIPAQEAVKELPDWPAETKPGLPAQLSRFVRGPHHPLIPAQAGIQFFQADRSVRGKLDARVRGHERRLASLDPDLQGGLTPPDFFTASHAGIQLSQYRRMSLNNLDCMMGSAIHDRMGTPADLDIWRVLEDRGNLGTVGVTV